MKIMQVSPKLTKDRGFNPLPPPKPYGEGLSRIAFASKPDLAMAHSDHTIGSSGKWGWKPAWREEQRPLGAVNHILARSTERQLL
jgi:hypothetical protein